MNLTPMIGAFRRLLKDSSPRLINYGQKFAADDHGADNKWNVLYHDRLWLLDVTRKLWRDPALVGKVL